MLEIVNGGSRLRHKNTTEYIQLYKPFSNFNSLEEFNNHIEQFLAVHKSDFTQSEFIAFRRLTKYCAKAYGVATASIGTILRAIEKMDCAGGISKSTFHRMRRKAIKNGILKVIERKQRGGNNSTNIWIFQQYDEKNVKIGTPASPEKKSKCETEARAIKGEGIKGQNKQLAPYKANNHIKTTNINKRKANRSSNSISKKTKKISKTKSNVPEAMRAILAAFFDDAKYIGEFWRMTQYYVRKMNPVITDASLLTLAVSSFTSVKRYMKDGTAKKPIAIYCSIFQANLQKYIAENDESVCLAASDGAEDVSFDALKKKLEARIQENDQQLKLQEMGMNTS